MPLKKEKIRILLHHYIQKQKSIVHSQGKIDPLGAQVFSFIVFIVYTCVHIII